jgi:hypothetical protein
MTRLLADRLLAMKQSGDSEIETARVAQPVQPNTRTAISGDRLHDRVNAVVTLLLERGELFQFEGALVRRKTPGSQEIVVVTEAWLTEHLREHFEFQIRSQPVEQPAALARFVAARWREFPAVLKTGKTAE